MKYSIDYLVDDLNGRDVRKTNYKKSWVPFAVAAGASLIGGVMGAKATKDAASQQAEATAQSLAQQQKQYEQSRADILAGQQIGSQQLMDYSGLAQNIYRALPQQYGAINTPSFQQQQGLAGSSFQGVQGLYGQAYPEIMRLSQQGYQSGINELYGADPRIQSQLAQGFTGAEQALGGAQYNVQPILSAAEQARQTGLGGVQGALQPYSSTGQQALQGYAQAAMDPYSSPLFQKRLEQGQARLNEQLAAQGLTNSGAQLELSRNLYEQLSAEEQSAAEQRMLNLAQMGYGAGQQQAGIAGQYGLDTAGQIGQLGLAEQQLQGSTASQLANLRAQQGMTGAGYTADLTGQLAQMYAGQGASGAAIRESQLQGEAQNMQDYYRQLSNIQEAQRIAGLQGQEQSSVGLANLYSQLGTGLANIQTGGSAPLAQLAQQYGQDTANLLTTNAQNAAASKLAQASGIGSTLTGLADIYGRYETNKQQQNLLNKMGDNPTTKNLYELLLMRG